MIYIDTPVPSQERVQFLPVEADDPMNRPLLIADLYALFNCQWIFFIVLTIILSGCYPEMPATASGTPPPFSCGNFTESYWQEFRFGIDSPDDVIVTASRLWKIDADDFTVNESSRHDFLWVVWKDRKGERLYSAGFREGQFHRVSVSFQPGHRPTLAQVINCLEVPEYFAAYEGHEDTGLDLSLSYPVKGFEIVHISTKPPPQSTTDLPLRLMNKLFVVAPGPPEQMVRDVYSYGHLSSVHAWGLCVLRPWPGSVEAIVVESFVDEDARCKSS